MADPKKISIDHAFIEATMNVLDSAVNDKMPNLDLLKDKTVDDTTGGDKGAYLETGLQKKVGEITAALAKSLGEQSEKMWSTSGVLNEIKSQWKDIEAGNKQQADFFTVGDTKSDDTKSGDTKSGDTKG